MENGHESFDGFEESQPPLRTPRTRNRSVLNTRHVSMMSLSNMSQSPKWTMSNTPRACSLTRRPLGPDPGNYCSVDPGLTSKMPRSPRAAFSSSTSCRKVLERDKESESPGPGAYSHITSCDLGMVPQKTPTTLSTPRARDRSPRSGTPDPGCYVPLDPQTTSKMGRSPSYGFASSRASRFPMLKERAPGPGAYVHSPEISSKGGTSFDRGPPRNIQRRPREMPDPGYYFPVDPSATSQMPRSPRANFESRSSTGRFWNDDKREREPSVPGPGQYAHKEEFGTSASTSFGRSSQRSPRARNVSPDPGAYCVVDPSSTSKMSKQAGYGFGGLATGRIPVAKALNGIEEADTTIDENGTIITDRSMNGTRSPRTSCASSKQDTPGPGSYEVIYSAPSTEKGAPQWGFGSLEARPTERTRASLQAPVPGPGSYVNQTAVGAGPKFTMRGRAEERRTSTPGPGEYGGHWTQFN